MTKPKAKTVLICIALLIFFLVIRFPFQNLQGYLFNQISKQTGILLGAEDMYITLFGWPGVGLTNMSATIPAQLLRMGSDIDLAAKKTVVRVGIGGIFPPCLSYSISISGLKKGGDLYLKLNRLQMDGQQFQSASVYFDADDVHLEQFSTAGSSPVLGTLTGSGSAKIDVADFSKTNGEFELNIDKLKTPGENLEGIVLPPILFGTLKAKLVAKNGTLEIANFQWGGGPDSEMQGSMAGDIKLERNFIASDLNITSLKIKMTDKLRDNPNSATIVTTLNSIDNRTPGSYSMKWHQTLAKISTEFLYVLPEKN